MLKDLLRPAYYFGKDFFDLQSRNRLKKNSALADQYLGKRIFLLLTGSSLQQIDISKLKNEYTLGANFIFLHEDIKKLDPTFFMTIDPIRAFTYNSFIWPEAYRGLTGPDRMRAYYRDVDDKLGNGTKLILHDDNYQFLKKNELLKNKTIYFVKAKKDLRLDDRIPYRDMADMTKRSIAGGGAVFFSILILMYMGFKEIYLAGAGYTYDPVYMLHFYENFSFAKSLGRKKAEEEARKAIAEHNKIVDGRMEFYDFWEKGDHYNGIYISRQDFSQNMEKHLLLNNYAKAQGVKIYNIVPEGFTRPIYEPLTWAEVERRIGLDRQG